MIMKSSIVGVSVTPGIGLEVAQVDFASQTVLKYGTKQIEYDIARREIADMDLFKEALQDLLFDMQIPKGTEVVLNFPSVVFKTVDYPAAMDEGQISNAIEEELIEHFIFKTTEPVVSAVKLPNSSIQFHKIAYTALQKSMLIEVAMAIKELGYKLYAVDTSVNSDLNALMYKHRVDTSRDKSWVLMIVDNSTCRILTMNGRNYVDTYEERISIGEVLGDAENYGTVVSAVAPILKNVPSQYLYVVSKTNVISAEVLASKLTYGAPIIHQEANCFSKEAMMELGPEVDSQYANLISLDVIGAAIYKDFFQMPQAGTQFNLFNKSLGDIYTMEQPPEISLGGNVIVVTNKLLISLFILLLILIVLPTVAAFIYFTTSVINAKNTISANENKAKEIQKFLDENKQVSAEIFDEGDEIRIGLVHNKNIYSYYTVVGTEIPKKLWLTRLKLSDKITIEGQADNLESVYAFFRSIKDYNPESKVKLQKLSLATSTPMSAIDTEEVMTNLEDNTDDILTSLNADFYEFIISDDPAAGQKNNNNNSKQTKGKKASKKKNALPALEPIND